MTADPGADRFTVLRHPDLRRYLYAAWWGIVPAVVVGGAVTIAVGAAWTRLFPVLWRLDRAPGPPDEHRR